MPRGWHYAKIKSFAQLSKDTWRVGDETLPYIGLEHISEGTLRLNSVGSSTAISSNKNKFDSGDTLFGKLRPYFRKVVKPKFNGICSTDIWVIRPKGNTDKDFIFYFFANQKLVDISYSSSSGTRMPRADWEFLSETLWKTPPLSEQRVIAEVLSSFDDKIDLLYRQNETLENMAQTLFRKCFIEDAMRLGGGGGQKTWKEIKLSDIYNFQKGFEPGSLSYQNKKTKNNVRFIRVGDMLNKRGQTYIDTNQVKTTCEVSDLLISFDGTVGRIAFGVSGGYSSHIRRVSSDDKVYDNLGFKYLLFSTTAIKETIHRHAKGTVILGAHSAIRFLSFRLPPKPIIQSFNKSINPLFDKILSNQSQTHTLENLRDTLLPKLLSGKIRVKAV